MRQRALWRFNARRNLKEHKRIKYQKHNVKQSASGTSQVFFKISNQSRFLGMYLPSPGLSLGFGLGWVWVRVRVRSKGGEGRLVPRNMD